MSKLAKILFSIPVFLGIIFIISVVNSQEPYSRQERASVTFKNLTPNLMVENMDTTISYYRKILNFELLMSNPEQKPFDWAMMQRGNVTLMFQTKKSLGDELADMKEMPVGGSLTFYVDVKNIKNLYEQLKGKADIKKNLHDTFYGMKEFVLRDCNGYMIVFAEEKQK
jgi:uncharacterized glyoxalase superfamily protein PhnB